MTIIKGDFTRKHGRKKSKDEKKTTPLYQIHVSLSFSEPLIWRRIQVPGDITLKQLHTILQLCMGWSGEHNHQFYVGKVFYNVKPSTDNSDSYYEGDYELQSLEEAMKWCFTYMYDAGDGWEHEMVVEQVSEAKTGRKIPILVDGEWAAPLEEIGSVHVYADVLWALENPEEEKSRKLIEKHGVEGFDPYHFDQQKINEELKNVNWAA